MIKNLNKEKIISLIQARTSSRRLPRKVLYELGNSTVLGQVIKKARIFSDKVIVCTSFEESDNEIEDYCKENNIFCYRGSLENVFLRYRDVLTKKEFSKYKWFARLTADNPLLSVKLAENLIHNINNNFDYICYEGDEIVIGTGIELVKKETFLKIDPKSLDKAEKEHVTLHLYEKAEKYKCKFIKSPNRHIQAHIRLTIDYIDDYFLIKKLFEIDSKMSAEKAIKIISRDKSFSEINKNCLQKKIR